MKQTSIIEMVAQSKQIGFSRLGIQRFERFANQTGLSQQSEKEGD